MVSFVGLARAGPITEAIIEAIFIDDLPPGNDADLAHDAEVDEALAEQGMMMPQPDPGFLLKPSPFARGVLCQCPALIHKIHMSSFPRIRRLPCPPVYPGSVR